MTIGKVGVDRRVFYALRLGSGAPATGVAPGDMIATVDNPAADATTAPTTVEIGGGRYYLDIPAAFTTTHGAGVFGGAVVVNSTSPRVVDVVPFEVVFFVADLDDLETEAAAATREATNTTEHTTTLTAVGLNETEASAATRSLPGISVSQHCIRCSGSLAASFPSL